MLFSFLPLLLPHLRFYVLKILALFSWQIIFFLEHNEYFHSFFFYVEVISIQSVKLISSSWNKLLIFLSVVTKPFDNDDNVQFLSVSLTWRGGNFIPKQYFCFMLCILPFTCHFSQVMIAMLIFISFFLSVLRFVSQLLLHLSLNIWMHNSNNLYSFDKANWTNIKWYYFICRMTIYSCIFYCWWLAVYLSIKLVILPFARFSICTSFTVSTSYFK